MKLLLATFLVIFTVTYARNFDPEKIDLNPAYGYLNKDGLRLAEEIRKAEESQTRISGGSEAILGEYPYQAGVIVYLEGGGERVCGGSLLNDNHVVTAAHCWNDGTNQAKMFTVVLGSTTLYSGGTRFNTSDVVLHENYTTTSSLLKNDIAMITLPDSVSTSDTIAPIDLPFEDELDEDFTGTLAVASGYGLTSEWDVITLKQSLKHAALKIISNDKCHFKVLSSNICTSGPGRRSTCHGDSGGPLVVSRNDRPILVGITSFGNACDGFPVVFVRVSSFIEWIYDHL